MWKVDFAHIESWLDQQDSKTVALVFAAFELLEEHGPALGRPLVDSLKGSSVKNLNELRPASSGATEVRIIFAFDRRREAIMLYAGDKSGGRSEKARWSNWYKHAIPLAERLFREHADKQRSEDV